MFKAPHLLTLTLLLITPHFALADNDQHFNQVNLQASAVGHVENDTLQAMLVVQESGSDPAHLAELVNRKMTKALDKAAKFTHVDKQTTNYTTRPMYKNNVIHSWQVMQTIKLSSMNFEQLGELLKQLKPLANIQSMHFTISDQVLEETQDELTVQAITKFRSKSAMIAKQFGKSSYTLVHVSIGNNYHAPRPMMERGAMVADMQMKSTEPALSAGTNKVTVNVNGTIELL
jgi:predicted secreted protein